MPDPSGRRQRIAIWVLVKLFLTLCGSRDDAPAAVAQDQPLTLTVGQAVRQAAKDYVP